MFEFDGQHAVVDSMTVVDSVGGHSRVEVRARVKVDDALLAQLGDATAFVRADVDTWNEIHETWKTEYDEAVARREAERERLRGEWEKEVDRCKERGVRPPEPPLPPALEAPDQPKPVSSRRRITGKGGYVNGVLVGERPDTDDGPTSWLAGLRGDVKGEPVVEVVGGAVSLTLRLGRRVERQAREKLADIVGRWMYVYGSQLELLARPTSRPGEDAEATDEATPQRTPPMLAPSMLAPSTERQVEALRGLLEAYWSDGWADVLVDELVGEDATAEPVRLLDRVFDVARCTRKGHLAPVELDDGETLMVPGVASKADLEAKGPDGTDHDGDEAADDQTALPLDAQNDPPPLAPASSEPASRPPVPGSLGQALEVLCSHWDEGGRPTSFPLLSIVTLLGGGASDEVRVRLQLLVALGEAVAWKDGENVLYAAAAKGGE